MLTSVYSRREYYEVVCIVGGRKSDVISRDCPAPHPVPQPNISLPTLLILVAHRNKDRDKASQPSRTAAPSPSSPAQIPPTTPLLFPPPWLSSPDAPHRRPRLAAGPPAFRRLFVPPNPMPEPVVLEPRPGRPAGVQPGSQGAGWSRFLGMVKEMVRWKPALRTSASRVGSAVVIL